MKENMQKTNGEQPQQKCWHTLCGISIFFLLMWITGAVLLSFGVGFTRELNKFDAQADFTALDDKCTVLNYTHVAEQRQDNHPFCVDVWTYTFRMASHDDTLFTSGADEKQHKKGTRCENVGVFAPSFEINEETTCWQPTAASSSVELASQPASVNSLSTLRSFYNCGNIHCIKILDPADEYAVKKARAALFLILGTSFLIVGLAMWCFLGAMIVRARNKEKVARVGVKADSAKLSTTNEATLDKALASA